MVPNGDYYRIDNRILTTPPGTGPRKIYINREPGAHLLTFWGSLPLDDSGVNEALAIDDPADFAAQTFRAMLEQRGITVYGRSRTRHNELANFSTSPAAPIAFAGGGAEKAPSSLPSSTSLVLAEHQSQPLLDDLQVINKVSQNLHAELLLRLLGREKGTAGTIEGGLDVLRGFLSRAGIRSDEYVFYDGSGLSRENLVTPHALVKLLAWADTQPWGKQYEETLPVAGIDGSLSQRFKASVAQGEVLGKTGSLGHVNSLAGYATTVRGERLVFAILVNNHLLSSQRALMTIDRIVEAMVQDGARK
jgi:D-alanyl-D-alanine carboxypeptidase/D-alanyl-D-alanine-endopeptidase (penicillin-binding protein 4)